MMNFTQKLVAGLAMSVLLGSAGLVMAQDAGSSAGQEMPAAVTELPMSRHDACPNWDNNHWKRSFPIRHHDVTTYHERNYGYNKFRSVVKDIKIDKNGILSAKQYVDSDHKNLGFCSNAEFTFFDHNGHQIDKETFERNCAAPEYDWYGSEKTRVLRRQIPRRTMCNMATMQVKSVAFEVKQPN